MNKVSIIVPCYNVENYLGELIESIQRQSFKQIEVVLVNDGSKDKTGNICDRYAKEDARLHVIHKQNGGVSAARNEGLKQATGEYVIFADADDYLPDNAIELLYNKAIQSNADIVIGDINQVFANREKMGRFYSEEFEVTERNHIQELVKTVFYKTYCPWPNQGQVAFGYGGPCNKLVRRKILVDNDILFDVRVKGIFDDIIYSAYILSVAEKVVYIPQNVYNYRILETSITHTYKDNMLDINRAIFEVWDEFLQQYNGDGIYTAAYYANVLRRFDASMSKYFFSSKNSKSIRERMKELKYIMSESPYKDIPQYVEINKLEKRHYIECVLLKNKSAYLLWIFFCLLEVYTRVRR